MIFGLYSIKDELSGFAAPIPLEDDKQAKRYFKQRLLDTPIMKSNPTDFSIWCIGQFDTNTGVIRAFNPADLVKVDWGVKENE